MARIYTAVATASGRDGRAVSSDGRLDVTLTPPGQDGTGTNPEQLFAAGYAACFASAMKMVARGMKLDVSDVSITAEVGLNPLEGKPGYGLDVVLRTEFPDSISAEQGQQLLEATHQVCPYSNATRGNIPVELVAE